MGVLKVSATVKDVYIKKSDLGAEGAAQVV
jgi:hypothetical protein